jgi:hypothetical protein
MKRLPPSRSLWVAALFMTVMTISVGQRCSRRTAHLSALEDWDICELADHLNCAGLQVKVCSALANGDLGRSVFLTTTDKEWQELNFLFKDPRWIQQWRGTVSCERMGEQTDPVLHVFGDHYLVVGPFLFFGDAELLERIRAILALGFHAR